MNRVNNNENSKLIILSMMNDGNNFFKLFKQGYDYKIHDAKNCDAFYYLMEIHNNTKTMKNIIEYTKFTDIIKYKNVNGYSLLHRAILCENFELVKLMLESGYDANEVIIDKVNTIKGYGNIDNDALSFAIMTKNLKICKEVIKYIKNPQKVIRKNYNDVRLNYLFNLFLFNNDYVKDVELINFILDEGNYSNNFMHNPNMAEKLSGITPLHLIFEHCDYNIYKLFMDKFQSVINIDLKDRYGFHSTDALVYNKKYKDYEKAEILNNFLYKMDVNMKDYVYGCNIIYHIFNDEFLLRALKETLIKIKINPLIITYYGFSMYENNSKNKELILRILVQNFIMNSEKINNKTIVKLNDTFYIDVPKINVSDAYEKKRDIVDGYISESLKKIENVYKPIVKCFDKKLNFSFYDFPESYLNTFIPTWGAETLGFLYIHYKFPKLVDTNGFKVYNSIDSHLYDIGKKGKLGRFEEINKYESIEMFNYFNNGGYSTHYEYGEGIYDRIENLYIHLFDYSVMKIPNNFAEIVNGCNKRFVIINVNVLLHPKINRNQSGVIVDIKFESGHANLMIIDKLKKEIEYFEPHGGLYNCIDKIGNIIIDILKNDKYRYFCESDYLPFTGVQNIESVMINNSIDRANPGGFCATWSILYAYIRLSNHKLDRKYVVENIIKYVIYNNKSMKHIARNFSNYFTDKIGKIVFKKCNVNVNSFLNHQELKRNDLNRGNENYNFYNNEIEKINQNILSFIKYIRKL